MGGLGFNQISEECVWLEKVIRGEKVNKIMESCVGDKVLGPYDFSFTFLFGTAECDQN